MNAETITTICYLYIFGTVIASIWAAQILERRLKTRSPQTLPYRWGYYFGCMGLAGAPFAIIFGCLTIIFATYDKPELFAQFLVYTAYFSFQAFCGWFIIKRRWWAWVFGTIFSFNILLWVINAAYGHKRRSELSRKPDISAPNAIDAVTPVGTSQQKTKTPALFFLLGAIAFCTAVIFFVRAWEQHRIAKRTSDELSNPFADLIPPDGAGRTKRQPTTAPHINFSPTSGVDWSGLPDQRALSPAEIFRRARFSVVLLTMQDARGHPISLGSGFFVDKNVIATNFHVIDGAVAGYAKVAGQTAKLNIKGTVGVDALHDLALLQLDTSSIQALSVAPNLLVNIGDPVYAIGNPQGLEGTFSQGIISSVRMLGSDRILQITAPISPGSSGGPVLDQTGSVIGVSFASVEKGQNLNFAIPSDYLTALQRTKSELHPFSAVPRAKARTTLLERIGNEQPLAGVTAENLTYDGVSVQTGEFSLSLHNKLRDNVGNIYGIVIFYDMHEQPIDVYPIKYGGIIPAGTAKRIRGFVDKSVERLNCPDRPFPYLSQPPRPPKGKVEFRILDFAVE